MTRFTKTSITRLPNYQITQLPNSHLYVLRDNRGAVVAAAVRKRRIDQVCGDAFRITFLDNVRHARLVQDAVNTIGRQDQQFPAGQPMLAQMHCRPRS